MTWYIFLFNSPRYSLSINMKLLLVEIVLFTHSPPHFRLKIIFFSTKNILMTECDKFYVVECSHNLNRLQMSLIAGTFPQRNNHCKLLLLCAFTYFQWKVLTVEGEILLRSQTSNCVHSELSNFTCACPVLPSGSELFSSTTYTNLHLVKLVIVQIDRRIFLQTVYIKR